MRLLRILYPFILCTLPCVYALSPDEKLAKEIEERVDREVARHKKQKSLEQRKLQRSINSQVKRELEWQKRKRQRKAARNKLDKRVRLHNVSRFADGDFFYKIPKWPFSAIYYTDSDLIEGSFTVNGASKAFKSNGSSQDITKLAFGEKDLVLQDILLASKLLRSGVLAANSAALENGSDTGSQYHFLYILADQPLVFDGSTNSQQFSFNYARHFHDNDISFGFQLPIVRRRNELRLKSSLSSSTIKELNNVTPNFFELHSSLEGLVENIINQREMAFSRRTTELGLGDIEAFANVEVATKRFERLIVGTKMRFPTANDSQIGDLWHADLGNGGFFEASAFVGALKSLSPIFNLHGFLDITVAASSKVSRRIPIRKVYDGETPGDSVQGFLTLGVDTPEVQFTSESFDEIDTTIRRFSGTSGTVKIHRGPQFLVRVGNIFEGVFDRKAFLDVFYDFRAKGSDYIGQRAIDLFSPSPLKNNTFQLEHRVGFNYDYQFSGRKRLTLGFLASIAGRNVPQTLQGDMAFSLEF